MKCLGEGVDLCETSTPPNERDALSKLKLLKGRERPEKIKAGLQRFEEMQVARLEEGKEKARVCAAFVLRSHVQHSAQRPGFRKLTMEGGFGCEVPHTSSTKIDDGLASIMITSPDFHAQLPSPSYMFRTIRISKRSGASLFIA